MVTEQDTKTIGELTTWLSGGTPRRSNTAFWQGNIPWISATTLKQAEIFESDQNVTPEAVRAGSKMAPLDSTLLLVRGSSLHKEIRAGLVVAPVCFNQDVKALVPADGVHPKFLTYSLLGRQKEILRLVSTASNSAGVLNTKQVQGLEVFFPLPEEQQAIAEALTDVDHLIASLEDLISKKKAIKEGAMQQLLTGKTRLPGFEDEWETRALSEIADPSQQWSFVGGPFGSNLKSSDYTDDGVRIIQLQNIGDGEFIDDSKIYTTREKANELISCNIFPGDIILSKMGDPVARACMIPSSDKRFLMCSDGIRLSVDRDHFNPYFICTMLNAPDFREAAQNASTGSTRMRIGLTQLRKLELFCPSIEEQNAISVILSDIDMEIHLLILKKQKAISLKQGMMQQLLTGRIRLASSKAKTANRSKAQTTKKSHTSEFDEAVVLSVLVNEFGSEKYPLGRFRRMKYAYLLHRHMEGKAEGYVKKAAGPYNPSTRYRGPERIAQQNRYVREASTGKWSGFVPFEKIDQAVGYFDSWYGDAPLEWMKQFRYKTNNELELLTTVDMAIVELKEANNEVNVASVRQVIKDHPEWKAKLDRPLFSNDNIARSIEESRLLFSKLE